MTITITTTPFNGSDEHLKFIQGKIDSFKKKLAELKNDDQHVMDSYMATAALSTPFVASVPTFVMYMLYVKNALSNKELMLRAGCSTLLAMGAYFVDPKYLAIGTASALGYYAYDRDQKTPSYQTDLHELVEIFKWSVKDIEALKTEWAMKLLEAVSPFVIGKQSIKENDLYKSWINQGFPQRSIDQINSHPVGSIFGRNALFTVTNTDGQPDAKNVPQEDLMKMIRKTATVLLYGDYILKEVVPEQLAPSTMIYQRPSMSISLSR